jgi:hypothetical protein
MISFIMLSKGNQFATEWENPRTTKGYNATDYLLDGVYHIRTCLQPTLSLYPKHLLLEHPPRL